MAKKNSIYILGTGLSHNGSTCLLKDGRIVVAIEKERLTRIKHDGGNDHQTVQYCLNAAGITINDLTLVVQCANFEKDIDISKYMGKRFFPDNYQVPVVTISHHLAHAYSAIGTSPFEDSNVLIIDGCGSPIEQCDDMNGAKIHVPDSMAMIAEKDSYYRYQDGILKSLYKDFSEFKPPTGSNIHLPTTRHSIGGLYSLMSRYVFGNMNDVGKLMGLAPYGDRKAYTTPLFHLKEERVFVNEDAFSILNNASKGFEDFKRRFKYFADIAAWTQKEVEKAILYTIRSRLSFNYNSNLCYAGGVALNAVANARILKEGLVDSLYIQPAAADNGIAIGCAYYGWLKTLKKEKVTHNGSTYFGASYSEQKILNAIIGYEKTNRLNINYSIDKNAIVTAAKYLAEGKIIAWYQDGAEFGPRALGNRSILADPRLPSIQSFINKEIKFREDFRPFAPSVLKEDASKYFKYAYDSPYMILVDEVLEEHRKALAGITHNDNSARVQTVTATSNPKYYELISAFKKETGLPILLNTSFNKRGMPIVETPEEAISLFYETKLDVLVMGNIILNKN
ncbi:MAG: carbamoyltransferase C-terminal domain-containing protein [Flavipsychrobacter sp.]